jgi:ribonuclease J
LRGQEDAFTDAARAGLRRIIGKRYGKRQIVEAHWLKV